MTPRRQREAATVLLACLAALLVVLVTAALVEAATFTVNSTCDTGDASPDGACNDGSGNCCLREAIDEVNGGAGGDTIAFGITGSGPHTITLGSVLPIITATTGTIDGTTQSGTVCCTGWDCSAAVWKIIIDADGGDFNVLEFGPGTTWTVKGLELINDLSTAEYGITLETGTATCNAVHGMRGGIVLGTGGTIGGAGANDANIAYNNGDFGFTSRATGGSTIQGNVACLAPDGETDGGTMAYGIYPEDSVDLLVTGNLVAGCDQAGVFVKDGSVDTTISDNTLGLTRSGATTLCDGFTAIDDNGTGTTTADNELCPPPPGCCNIDGLPGIVTCLDYSVLGGTAPTSQAECETIIDDIVGEPDTASATSYNADAVCDPDALGSCPAASTPTATATATGTSTATATETDTPTATATATGTSTETPTVTATGTVTDTPTQTATATGTVTDTPTATATSTETGTATDTPTATATETPTATSTGTVTDTPTSTATETGTATQTATATTTPTATPTPTDTPTGLASPTATKAKRLRHYKIRVPRVRAVPG